MEKKGGKKKRREREKKMDIVLNNKSKYINANIPSYQKARNK